MKKVLRISAIMLLFIIAVGALAAGYSFIVEPSGKGVGISTDYLRTTAPFKNYLIPGIVLFTVNGILSVIIAVSAIKKVKHYTLLVLIQGCIFVGWIAIQLTMVTLFHPLHAIVASIGIILILIGGSLIAADYKEAVRQQYRRIHSLPRKYAETPLGKIEFIDYGEGQPVLLVHGVMGGCDHGLDISQALFGEGYRVIAVSRFGYVGSPVEVNSSPAAQADLYAALLDTLNIKKVIIAGFSAGGPSTLQFALRHQNRCALLILISMAVPPYKTPGKVLQWVMRQFFGSDFAFWFLINYSPAIIMKLMGTPYSIQRKLTLSEANWQKELMWKLLPARVRICGIINDACITNPDLNTRYPIEKIKLRALVFHAVDDPMPPFGLAKQVASKLPNGYFVQIPSGGHLLISHHNKVQKIIRTFTQEKRVREENSAQSDAQYSK
jgi:2-hydroxy-6-oxonona-2,4-dienedioate hydrolase